MDLRRRTAQLARGGGHIEVEKIHLKVLKQKLRKLDIKKGKLVANGTVTKVYKNPKLKEIYGRDNLCLKVFWRSRSIWGYEGAGGISTILESTIAQNLIAMKGLAPRVYDLVEVEGMTAQVVEYLTGKEGRVEIKDSRLSFYVDDCLRDHNYRGGKLIDFQGTKLKDYKEYKEFVIRETIRVNAEHGHTVNLYQSTDYMKGLRDTKKRLARYKLKDFKGKTVLDVGCSNGMMMREAYKMGAKRVIGIDWPDMAECAETLAILDGFYNLDFYGADIKKLSAKGLKKLTGLDHFDIILFFAMEAHVGRPEWLKNCKTFYYEGHGKNRVFNVTRK